MKNKLISIAVASVIFSASPSASAGCPTCLVDSANDSGIVAAAASAMSSLVGGVVAAFQAAQLSFMNLESAQQHADAEKANVVNRAIAEASVDANNMHRLKENVADISDRTADNGQACKSMMMGLAVDRATKSKRSFVEALTEDQKKRTMQTQSAAADMMKTYEGHEPYCEQYDQERGRCATAAPQDKQGLDLEAGNLYSPNEEKTYSPDQLKAARLAINGIVNPFVSTELPVGYEKSPQGKAYIAAKRVEQQRLSLAYESLNQIMAARTATTAPGGKSEMAATQKVAKSAINPVWQGTLESSVSDEQFLKENVKQVAFRNMMDYKTYLQMERVEMMLATSLAMKTKESAAPLLAAQRNAASVAAGVGQ